MLVLCLWFPVEPYNIFTCDKFDVLITIPTANQHYNFKKDDNSITVNSYFSLFPAHTKKNHIRYDIVPK